MLDENHGSKGCSVVSNDLEEVGQSLYEMGRADDCDGDEATLLKAMRPQLFPDISKASKTYMAVATIEKTQRGT